jgi:hypothetical protein
VLFTDAGVPLPAAIVAFSPGLDAHDARDELLRSLTRRRAG